MILGKKVTEWHLFERVLKY